MCFQQMLGGFSGPETPMCFSFVWLLWGSWVVGYFEGWACPEGLRGGWGTPVVPGSPRACGSLNPKYSVLPVASTATMRMSLLYKYLSLPYQVGVGHFR